MTCGSLEAFAFAMTFRKCGVKPNVLGLVCQHTEGPFGALLPVLHVFHQVVSSCVSVLFLTGYLADLVLRIP